MALGIHLFPFRTEKLSPITPMVLRNSGRVGSRRIGSARSTRRRKTTGSLFLWPKERTWKPCLCQSLHLGRAKSPLDAVKVSTCAGQGFQCVFLGGGMGDFRRRTAPGKCREMLSGFCFDGYLCTFGKVLKNWGDEICTCLYT